MTLPEDIESAISEFAVEHEVSREEAIVRILREWLEGNGYIPVDPIED